MSFLRNAGFNFVGALLPALALFVTIPLIVHRLGADAYGALVLITSIVGYFGIIDVNATAGSVKYLAEYQADGKPARVNEVLTFGLVLYGAIGLAGGLGLWGGASALVNGVFKVPEGWRGEAVLALKVSAAAFLVGQLQQYLQSIPQALNRFDLSGQLDAVFGSLIPLLTIAVVLLGGGLVAIVAARLASSLVHCGVLAVLLHRLLPAYRPLRPSRQTVRQVSSFSAFAYLQRIASVTYLNADKLLVGAHHSMLDLATYVIPYTLVSRLYSMLYRLTQSLFPMASALAATGDIGELKRTYVFAKRYTFYLNACVCLMFALFAQEVLHYWLGKGLGGPAPLIMVLVAYGLFLESTTNIPSLVNDGLGRPHITGAAAILRVGIGLAMGWWAIATWGIVALAISNLVVSAVMSIGFVVVVHRWSLPWSLASVAMPVYAPGAIVLLAGTPCVVWRFGSVPMPAGPFAAMAVLLAVALVAGGWYAVLSTEHRERLRGVVHRRLHQS